MNQRQGQLGIGLTYYQECQWLSAIKKHGVAIMGKSLLSKSQQQVLVANSQLDY